MVLEELENMIVEVRKLKKEVNEKNTKLKKLKEDLRTFMIDSAIKDYNGVEIRRVISFDVELFRLEKPDIFDMYGKREQVTSFRNVMSKASKDRLRKEAPQIYKEYIEEKTAQLRGL